MSTIEKIPYEISIWDDILTYHINYTAGEKAGQSEDVAKLPVFSADSEDAYQIEYQWFDERKVAVIGADNMDAQTRAHNPLLTRNVNGTVTLSFVLYNHIFDYETGEYRDNPFIKLLTNERKIKLRYDEAGVADPWHDLIIKNIQESSDNKTYTYTAASLPVNELSKNGYNIELDNTTRVKEKIKKKDTNRTSKDEELSLNQGVITYFKHIAGSEKNFVKLMNEKSNMLGMSNTHYSNCTGLPTNDGYSSALDQALVLKEVLSASIKYLIYMHISVIFIIALIKNLC